jgi:hypothetical protein
VATDGRPGGRRATAEPGLCVGELRQWLGRLGDDRSALPSRGHWRLLRSIEVLRRRVEQFNQGVPTGLRVELNPELVGLLAEAPLEES